MTLPSLRNSSTMRRAPQHRLVIFISITSWRTSSSVLGRPIGFCRYVHMRAANLRSHASNRDSKLSNARKHSYFQTLWAISKEDSVKIKKKLLNAIKEREPICMPSNEEGLYCMNLDFFSQELKLFDLTQSYYLSSQSVNLPKQGGLRDPVFSCCSGSGGNPRCMKRLPKEQQKRDPR